MRCFVIMPIGDPQRDHRLFEKSQDIYCNWIKPAVESTYSRDGKILSCHRADVELRPGDIVQDIIAELVTADVVIADLSGRNPNVFYEFGIRHATNNSTILLAEGAEHIPFDVHSQQTIIYEYTPPGMLNL